MSTIEDADAREIEVAEAHVVNLQQCYCYGAKCRFETALKESVDGIAKSPDRLLEYRAVIEAKLKDGDLLLVLDLSNETEDSRQDGLSFFTLKALGRHAGLRRMYAKFENGRTLPIIKYEIRKPACLLDLGGRDLMNQRQFFSERNRVVAELEREEKQRALLREQAARENAEIEHRYKLATIALSERVATEPKKAVKGKNKVWPKIVKEDVAARWIRARDESPSVRYVDVYEAERKNKTKPLPDSIKDKGDFADCLGAARKAKLIPPLKRTRRKSTGKRCQ